MEHTVHHRSFKKRSGSINHYYITAYIGISLLNEKTNKPSELSTYWNPKDIELTKSKTKYYLSDSGILNMCAMVEGYINDILNNICPFIKTESEELKKLSDKTSIVKKIKVINEFLSIEDKNEELNLLLLMFQHRNNIIHSGKVSLERDIANRINSSSKKIKKDYKNMCVNQLIKNVNDFKSLTFKEVLSLFSASHNYIEKIDNLLASKLDKQKYLEYNLKNDDKAKVFFKKFSTMNDKDRIKNRLIRFIEINYGIPSIELQEENELNNLFNILKVI